MGVVYTSTQSVRDEREDEERWIARPATRGESRQYEEGHEEGI